MFDGIKVQDVSVSVDGLLTNNRLTFGGLVDMQTGFVLNPIRRANDRGLNFRLIPRRVGSGYRVEVKGSLHKFSNNGLHNADQYTANDMLLTLDRLVTEYGFNLSESKINNIEFGVNIELPFAISQIFANLICYKNQPFALDSHSQTPYYACNWQHYTVKIYDKGKQNGLGGNLLRFEIRVNKMQYFSGTGIQLRTLADLLNVANYSLLGALIVDTFNEILFDDPAIDLKALTAKERTLYEKYRNPRYWRTPDNLTLKQATAHRQQMCRSKNRFRALLHQYGSKWQQNVSTLICQTWGHLTAVDDNLLTQIERHKMDWQNITESDNLNSICSDKTNCHKLTDVIDADLSRINSLCSEVLRDEDKTAHSHRSEEHTTAYDTMRAASYDDDSIICPVTGILINEPRPRQRFVSATMLRKNPDLLQALQHNHKQYAKGSKEDECSRAAHNVRNVESNARNNLIRRIQRIADTPMLFPLWEMVKLTPQQESTLTSTHGTHYEISPCANSENQYLF